MGQINFSCWEVTTRMESVERQGFKRKIHDASEKSVLEVKLFIIL